MTGAQEISWYTALEKCTAQARSMRPTHWLCLAQLAGDKLSYQDTVASMQSRNHRTVQKPTNHEYCMVGI
eukprot:2752336-Rhodomonas_salina.1